jgi:hypothetical protein
MLVLDYLDQVVKSMQNKYSTNQSLICIIWRLGIVNCELNKGKISSTLIHDKVDCMTNHNLRRRIHITARIILKNLGAGQNLPKSKALSMLASHLNLNSTHQ